MRSSACAGRERIVKVRRGGLTACAALSTLVRLTSCRNDCTYSVAGLSRMSSGVPSCTSSPSFRIAMRLPKRSASSRSCVMNTMVLFSLACSCSRWSCISRRISGSRAEKASSINRISASVASARANPTRCCIPPDNWWGYWFSKPDRPTWSSQWRARCSRSARATPCTASP
ncbi:Protein of uncharacterised function (DUF1602) [Bordetella pertussis]|nr:Protein of uncharacterised function (DUF1602) [Bordetella pertussis]CFW14822.1 Protein of uncharacterised function (DUF1602) [Bordetella pertussis]CFW43315.1 Protein of uncharacterised function (DUF1602) [Bordetella pertussis]CPO40358.1 Protein of uncharacterised function (DUF1602) [Bordetella pertussis]